MPNISYSPSVTHTHDIVALKNVYVISISETTTEVIDSVARKYISKRSVTELPEILDAVTRIYSTVRTLLESSTIIIDQSPIVSSVIGRSVSESITIETAVVKVRDVFRSISESLTIESSVLANVGTVVRNISESIDIVDLVARIKNASIEIALPESVTVSAVVAKSQSLIRTMVESVVLMVTNLDIGVPDQQFFQRIIHDPLVISTGLHIRTCWLSINKGPAPVIIKRIGRFFTMLPQHSAKPYTYKSKFIKYHAHNDEVL